MRDDEPIQLDALLADVDRASADPLYVQVSRSIEAAIRSGAIPPGARLENEIAVGQRAGLSRPTIRRAMQELVDLGLLVRRRGVGTQVVPGRVTRGVELTSLYEDLKSSAHEPATDVLQHGIRPADAATAEALGVAVGADVVHLRRRRSSDGVPVAVLENFLPVEFRDIAADALEQRGLYEILRARGAGVRVANQRIGARRARGDEGALLEIDDGAPVLTMDRVAFDASGRAVECGHHCYRPDLYGFETTLVAK
jgi:DNA-binding GntR family transcriptional regulator